MIWNIHLDKKYKDNSKQGIQLKKIKKGKI